MAGVYSVVGEKDNETRQSKTETMVNAIVLEKCTVKVLTYSASTEAFSSLKEWLAKLCCGGGRGFSMAAVLRTQVL